MYQYPISRHFLFRIGDAGKGRQFLSQWLPHVTHAGRDLSGKPEPLVNLAITWQGLLALNAFDHMGGPKAAEEAFFWDFREAPDPVSLGDFGDSAPAHWWNKRFSGEAVHLTVHGHFRTPEGRDAFTADVRASARECELEELIPTRDGTEPLTGETLNVLNGRELHFGYQDGFSQPHVNWRGEPNRPDLVDFRHFLLGYWTNSIQTFPRTHLGVILFGTDRFSCSAGSTRMSQSSMPTSPRMRTKWLHQVCLPHKLRSCLPRR